MKIGLTGATGFVGSYLLKALMLKGMDTVCFIRKDGGKKTNLQEMKTEIRFLDLTDKNIDSSIFQGVDTIFHLAGSVFEKDADALFATNVLGTERLYRALSGSQVRRFVFLSSLAALGPAPKGEALTETSEPHPISIYGRSKLEAEKRIKALRGIIKTDICIVRAPLIYGIGMSEQSRLAIFLRRLRNRSFKFIGDGYNIVSLTQVDNLVNFLLKVIEFDRIDTEIYHIGDPVLMTFRELVSLTANHLHLKHQKTTIPVSVATAVASILDILSIVTKNDYYLSKERVRELSSSWLLNLKKIETCGYRPLENWQNAYCQTIDWLITRIN